MAQTLGFSQSDRPAVSQARGQLKAQLGCTNHILSVSITQWVTAGLRSLSHEFLHGDA